MPPALCERCRLPDRVEVSVIESEKILVLVVDALNGMRLALREIPDVSDSKLLDLLLAVLVNGRDDHSTSIHESPLGDFVPVQFPDRDPASDVAGRRRCRGVGADPG